VREGYIARKLCPDLIFVKLNMSRYAEVSKQIMAIFRQYDPNMLAASVDEAYLKQVTFSSTGECFLTV
jgi:DNA polymerase kappa